MKAARQILAAPFVLLALVFVGASVVVDLVGIALVAVGALIAGEQ